MVTHARMGWIGVSGLIFSLGLTVTARADLIAKDAGQHVFLIQNDGKGIRDDDFAKIISGKLISAGASNVLDAKFMFSECFGGGMVNDLSTSLDNTVKWVGGSASTWKERSGAQVTDAEAKARGDDPKYVSATPQGYWVKELIPQLGMDQSLLKAMDAATSKDQVGPNGDLFKGFEQGQSTSGNGGDTIKLKDPAAKSYHAVLWAGKPDRQNMTNDVANMRQALVTAWGDPATNANVTIDILFGDGTAKIGGQNTMAATRGNLVTTIDNLALDKNEQFLFFAADHGGSGATVQAPTDPPRKVVPKQSDVESFLIPDTTLTAIETDESTAPLLTVDYSGVFTTGVDSVSLNGFLLGYLDATRTEMNFVIPLADLMTTNSIQIVNNDLSSFDITEKEFFSGAIGQDPPSVPEPSTIVLLAIGIGALSLFRRGRGQKQMHKGA